MNRATLRLYAGYRRLPQPVWRLVMGTLLLQLINTSYLLIFNIYLAKAGYDDQAIGGFVSMRFLGTLLLAFPLGLYLRGRLMRAFFVTAAVLFPLASVAVLVAAWQRWDTAMLITMLVWGMAYVLLQVSELPFLLRTVPEGQQTEAIALLHTAMPAGQLVGGALILGLSPLAQRMAGDEPAEVLLLLLFSLIGLAAVPLFASIREGPLLDTTRNHFNWAELRANYDWPLVLRALVPTTLLAVGAGLTIPFVNLYFYSVFGLDSAGFGALGAVASLLVVGGALVIPAVLRRYGYGVALTGLQVVAVGFLVLMALCEIWAAFAWALPLAAFSFLMRQPLMSTATPLAHQLTMQYVGTRHHELVSALHTSIWSGGWVISAAIFRVLRGAQIPYWEIFLLTAVLYSMGVAGYAIMARHARAQRQNSTS